MRTGHESARRGAAGGRPRPRGSGAPLAGAGKDGGPRPGPRAAAGGAAVCAQPLRAASSRVGKVSPPGSEGEN